MWQNVFLSVSSVVTRTTRCEKGSYSRQCDGKTNANIPLLMFLFFVFYHLMPFGHFYGSEIRHGIFFGLNFNPGIFGGFCLKPWECFWVSIFAPIRSSLSLEIRSTPPPPPLPPRLTATTPKLQPLTLPIIYFIHYNGYSFWTVWYYRKNNQFSSHFNLNSSNSSVHKIRHLKTDLKYRINWSWDTKEKQ